MTSLKRVIASGTFDRLHVGHQRFLESAFAAGETVYCFVTDFGDYRHCQEKALPMIIESYQERLEKLQIFLAKRKYQPRVKILPLHDVFGPTLESKEFDGLVVSQETLPTAKLINQKRKRNGLRSLEIIMAETVEDGQKEMLSSSRIRLGRVDRQGLNFAALLPQKTLYLPESLRGDLKKPLGRLLVGSQGHLGWAALKAGKFIDLEKTPLVITVGDIATQAFLNHNLPVDLAIIDQKTRREKFVHLNQNLLKQRQLFKAVNRAGTISPSLTVALTKIFNQSAREHLGGVLRFHPRGGGNHVGYPTVGGIGAGNKAVLLIKGEEDLAVLPSMLLAPLNSLIFYGQPDQGLVKIKVTEAVKEKAVELLKKFVV